MDNRNDDGARKRQKRAELTTVNHGTSIAGSDLPLRPAEVPDQENYDHLLHWNRGEDDDVIEWDQEGWGQADEDPGDEDEGDIMEDEEAPDITDALDYNDLDAAEMAIRDIDQQPQERAGKVRRESVIRIINESMEAFTNNWSPSKDSELALANNGQPLDPVRLWEDAEALGHREQLVDKYTFEIKLYENKLDRLAAEICRIPQHSEKQVRQHCRNLEMHVHNLEAARWYLSIYEMPPADAGDDSDGKAHHTTIVKNSSGRKDAEVIDLGSSPESSDNDDRELIVDVEEPAIPNPSVHRPVMPETPRTLKLVRTESMASEAKIISSIEVSPASGRAAKPTPKKPHGSRPEIASILTVSAWNMEDLVAAKDRKRITMKVVLEMTRQEREMIRNRMRAVKKPNLLKEIGTCVNMMYRKEQKMLGVLPSDLPKIKVITNFFLSWWLADDYMRKTPTNQQLQELASELDKCNDLETFYDWAHFILHKNFSEGAFQNAHAPSQEEVIVISD